MHKSNPKALFNHAEKGKAHTVIALSLFNDSLSLPEYTLYYIGV